MSLMTFLYASEGLRLEQGVRFHVETEVPPPEPTPEENRARNQQAMASLMGMMKGVQR